MRIRAIVAAFLLLLHIPGCSDGTGPSVGPPAHLLKVGANPPPAAAGTAVADSLEVRITDARNNPVAGIDVVWAVTEGGGSLSPTSTRTNAAGEARAAWTLGTAAGENSVTASSDGLSPVSFITTGVAGPAANLAGAAGDDQAAEAGARLSDSLAVRVTDAHGNPVAGATVAWAVTSGGGAVSPTNTDTDAGGQARTAWTLGTAAGDNSVTATVTGLQTVSFHATGTAGTPAEVLKVSGDSQSAEAGSSLTDPLVVRVRDATGNPVSDIPVAWSVSAGGGTVTPPSASTNAAGEASASWTVGTTVGDNQVSAVVEGLPVLTFTAEAVAGPAAELSVFSGDAQSGPPGAMLPDSLAVRVTDRNGNPVDGIAVTWSATRGGGEVSPSSSTTSSAGVARASWRLGGTIGSQSAAAAIGEANLEAEFVATADPPDPPVSTDTIQLDPGVVVGREVFPRGNTDQGGQGEVVAGVGCIDFTVTYHVHAHVSLFVDGEQLALPAAVGITDFVMNEQDTYVASGACFYWLHLHDASGVIHIEPPSERALTLGQLFAIWGRPLTRENVAGYEGPVTVHVDGVEYTGELADIVFEPYREITLQVGEPLDTLPAYRFNPGY